MEIALTNLEEGETIYMKYLDILDIVKKEISDFCETENDGQQFKLAIQAKINKDKEMEKAENAGDSESGDTELSEVRTEQVKS